MGKSSPSPPPAPDYSAAAQATAAGNLEAARVAAKANRVNQYTPYGNLIYTQDEADPDIWSSRIDLSPAGQQLLDYSDAASIGLGQQTGQALDRVDQTLSQPFDYSSVGDVQNAAQGAITSRLDPMWEARDQQNQTMLRNQGLLPGSEAYENSRREFNQGRNDAYQQAVLAGIQTQPQTMQLATALRNQPLNELNALRTGSQVTNPSFTNAPQQQTTQGPNMLQAAMGQGQYDQGLYNAQVGASNAQGSATAGLAGAAMTAAAIF